MPCENSIYVTIKPPLFYIIEAGKDKELWDLHVRSNSIYRTGALYYRQTADRELRRFHGYMATPCVVASILLNIVET